MRRTHCATMISRRICQRENAIELAASHCVSGIDCTAPRSTSATLALAGSASPTTTLNQSGNGTIWLPIFTSNGKT